MIRSWRETQNNELINIQMTSLGVTKTLSSFLCGVCGICTVCCVRAGGLTSQGIFSTKGDEIPGEKYLKRPKSAQAF